MLRRKGHRIRADPGNAKEMSGEYMTNGMMAFLAALGGASLVCYLLMNRVQNRSARRDSAGGDSGSSSYDLSGGSGWNPLSWFSSDSSSSDSSDSSGYSSGGDSGGGDSGGGGDGGGGGD